MKKKMFNNYKQVIYCLAVLSILLSKSSCNATSQMTNLMSKFSNSSSHYVLKKRELKIVNSKTDDFKQKIKMLKNEKMAEKFFNLIDLNGIFIKTKK